MNGQVMKKWFMDEDRTHQMKLLESCGWIDSHTLFVDFPPIVSSNRK